MITKRLALATLISLQFGHMRSSADGPSLDFNLLGDTQDANFLLLEQEKPDVVLNPPPTEQNQTQPEPEIQQEIEPEKIEPPTITLVDGNNYESAYLIGMQRKIPIMVFVVKDKNTDIIKFVNDLVFKMKTAGDGYAVGVVDAEKQPPLASKLSTGDHDVICIVWENIDGSWKKTTYIGVDQISIMINKQHQEIVAGPTE